MKISQEGIEEVRKKKKWVKEVELFLSMWAPQYYCPFEHQCREACYKIFPELQKTNKCPCNIYGLSEILQIAKQIVGEEAADD